MAARLAHCCESSTENSDLKEKNSSVVTRLLEYKLTIIKKREKVAKFGDRLQREINFKIHCESLEKFKFLQHLFLFKRRHQEFLKTIFFEEHQNFV